MSTVEQDTDLFPSSDYEIPFNRPEPADPDQVQIRLRGSIKLNRNEPAHMNLLERMKLGKTISLNILATTTSAGDQYRIDNDGHEQTTYVVTLNADMLEAPER